MSLPPPKNSIGYTTVEIDAILKGLDVERMAFRDAMGLCTMIACPETGETLTPVSDVKRALDIVATGSSPRLWD